MNLLSMSN